MTKEEMEKFCQVFNDIFLDKTIRCYVVVKPEVMLFFEIAGKQLALDAELTIISVSDPRLVHLVLPVKNKSKLSSFIDLCLRDKAELSEIGDYIDYWHQAPYEKYAIELREYLGMTCEEYRSWVADPHSLVSIIDARRKLMIADKT